MGKVLLEETVDVQEVSNMILRYLSSLPSRALELVVRMALAVLFFLIGVQLSKLLRRLLKRSMTKAGVDIGAVQFVDSFLRTALYVVLVFMVAASFGVDAASIVALLGSAGVAVGLAVQGGLSNLVGGVLILILKPFTVGDYIMDDKGHSGTVSQIQIFHTKLLTPDNQTVLLPNGDLANNCLINVTASHKRRLDIPVSVSYRADLKKAKAVLLEMLQEDPDVMKDHEMTVIVDELADSGVKLIVRCWMPIDAFWPGKWRLTEQCKYVLDDNGIEIPYPQMDVHLDDMRGADDRFHKFEKS